MQRGNEFEHMTVEDLMANDRFLRWVKHPDEELNAYWADKFAQYPGLEPVANAARELILQLTFETKTPPTGRREALFDRIKAEAGIDETAPAGEDTSAGEEVQINKPAVRPIRRWLQVAATVSLVALAGAWIYTQYTGKPTGGLADSPQFVTEKKKGLLYLSDGRIVTLTDIATGDELENNTLRLQSENHLVYQPDGTAGATQVDSILSPIGQVYRVDLPDGSRMWLNSGTTVGLVSAFMEHARQLSVSGQAYFEVAPHAEAPFTVSFEKGQLTVLGTHFDVMSYPEAPSAVTLLEGNVRVSDHGKFSNTLLPGEQVTYPAEHGTPTVAAVDTTLAIAWKNGAFAFHETPVDQVMGQVARWYGVNVTYTEDRPVERISGTIPTDLPLAGLLDILNGLESDASCSITPDGIVVTRK